MPVFYFHVVHDSRASSPTALNLPDKKAAWEEATVTAGQILRDLGGALQPGSEWRIDVADSARKPILSLRVVAEAFE
ncbi:MAG TPA: hypothetical protein VHV58_08340 [Pseudolabrys sp.]|jgi:hypothetical protein|nr:hypothetical protein [Pseudolabrys sp.]